MYGAPNHPFYLFRDKRHAPKQSRHTKHVTQPSRASARPGFSRGARRKTGGPHELTRLGALLRIHLSNRERRGITNRGGGVFTQKARERRDRDSGANSHGRVAFFFSLHFPPQFPDLNSIPGFRYQLRFKSGACAIRVRDRSRQRFAFCSA